MASVYRPTGRRKWYVSFRDPGSGRRVTVPGYVDRQATAALATDLERRAARVAAGLEHATSHAARVTRTPADYESHLLDRGCCEAWARTCRQRIAKWQKHGVACLAKLTVDTRRRYKQLLIAWCSFAGMPPPDLPDYSTRESGFRRRALSREELHRLLAGPRSRVYTVAAYTGLRRGELRRLDWRDVGADRITLYGKAGRVESVPLHRRVVEALGPRGEGRVFPAMPDRETVKRDYAKAGVVDDGRKADFHSLRYTFCTMLALAGVNVWDAMKLMRHRDVRLTTRLYLDATQLDTEAAIRRLA